jgi:hypothetical protein
MHAEAMISSHPQARGQVNDAIVNCIEACLDCLQVCITCADACLSEQSVDELVQCIRLDLDCAELCHATSAIASRRTGSNEEILRKTFELCGDACRLCAEECEKHAHTHRHCLICAETCRSCEQACRSAMATVTLPHQ